MILRHLLFLSMELAVILNVNSISMFMGKPVHFQAQPYLSFQNQQVFVFDNLMDYSTH